MRFTRFCSPLKRVGSSSRRRFSEPPLCRNWWLLCDRRRVIFPVPVTLNRFAAVLFVFNFGILLFTYYLWFRREHHDHQPAFHRRRSLHHGEVFHFLRHSVEPLSS